MTVFGVEAKDAKTEKLPTIRQFVKSVAKSKYKSDGVVELVWLPNRFPNITLQTDCFRVIIAKNHPFFKPLGDILAGVNERTTGIRVEIVDWKSATYVLHELPEEQGHWDTIGDTGLRFVERN